MNCVNAKNWLCENIQNEGKLQLQEWRSSENQMMQLLIDNNIDNSGSHC